MRKLFYSISVILFLGLTGYSQSKPKNVMVLLGSADPEILSNRVNVASKFYHVQKFDKIIVSGGCGAHASMICEASSMKNQLVAKGVPANIIYKEENSKTTVQNYIFSRILKDENGEQIIQKKDSVYVVSDHWHAIAVAARFNKYDDVYAKFFIEGDLVPKPTDLLDYGGIFNKEVDNQNFILKGLWPTPDAVFTKNGVTNYVFSNRFISVNTEKKEEAQVALLTNLEPALPSHWKTVDGITSDTKAGSILMFNKLECRIYFDKKGVNERVIPLNKLVIDLPANVKSIDASFIKNKDLYLFTGEKVIIASKKGDGFVVKKVENITKFVSKWPYAWGNGDLTAADYDEKNKVIHLYKNREVLTIDEKIPSESLPKRLNLKWQDIK